MAETRCISVATMDCFFVLFWTRQHGVANLNVISLNASDNKLRRDIKLSTLDYLALRHKCCTCFEEQGNKKYQDGVSQNKCR